MTVKAIFVHCGLPFWVDVAFRLKEQHGWDICYLVGPEYARRGIKEKFPEAVFHCNEDANKSIFPKECSKLKMPALDKELLNALSANESILLKMLDRLDYDGTLSYQKRAFYYHSQLIYWKAVIDHFKPDVVVFRTMPHACYDYILYSLCLLLNVRTIITERTSIPGLLYLTESFEKGSEKLLNEYQRKVRESARAAIKLSEGAQQHIDKIQKDYSEAMPFHLQYKLKLYSRDSWIRASISELADFSKDLLKRILVRELDSGFLRRKYYTQFIGRWKRRQLYRHYLSLAGEVDLHEPFIFVALQCEPERQASPSGDIFGDQYLMIDMLSKHLPDGWKLYVKEHVSQFRDYQRAERARSKGYYDYIASMLNVRLVPLSYSSFSLIDDAKAVATISGTVGWETVLRNKPALLFGYSWYRGCEGVFATPTVDTCRAALQEIAAGFSVDRQKVLLFVSTVEEISIKGYNDKIYEKGGFISHDENVSNLAEGIHLFYGSVAGDERIEPGVATKPLRRRTN